MIRATLIGAASAALIAGLVPGLSLAEPEPTATPQPAVWKAHQVELEYLGFTSHYSCDGLESTLHILLKALGAREDAKIYTYGCDRGFTEPVRFPRAVLKFSTLEPLETSSDTAWDTDTAGTAPAAADHTGAAASAPVSGVWRTVEIAPNRPYPLGDGDCELIEQFRDKVLPLFATRDQQLKLNCIPYQDIGPFSVHLQVFAPLPAAKAR